MSDAAPAAEKIRPGQVLAAARAELKLSQADVSQQIKYSIKQIAAIEADEYDKLPGTTFVRGMIRSYAKLVQVEAEPLLVDFGRRDNPAAATADFHGSGQEPFVEGGTKSNRVYVLLSLVALLAVAVVAYEWWRNPLDTGQVVTIKPRSEASDADARAPQPAPEPASESAPQSAPQSAPTPAAAPPAATAPAAAATPQDSARATAPPPVAAAATPATAAPAAAASAAAATSAAAAAPSSAASGPLKRIELEFDKLCWVEIKQADGKILMSKLNQPGTKQVVEGVAPFEVVIGNAASTRLKYNDAPVDLRPYFKVDVARLKLE